MRHVVHAVISAFTSTGFFLMLLVVSVNGKRKKPETISFDVLKCEKHGWDYASVNS